MARVNLPQIGNRKYIFFSTMIFLQYSRFYLSQSKFVFGQFSVKTPTPVHPLLKVRKPWQIWLIFSLQDVLERKKYKNDKKNSMKLVR
jgi:hypothetical protein